MTDPTLSVSGILRRCKPLLDEDATTFICVAIDGLANKDVAHAYYYDEASAFIRRKVREISNMNGDRTLYGAMRSSGRIPEAMLEDSPHWPVVRNKWLDITIEELEKEGR